jgi:hypothetical protein
VLTLKVDIEEAQRNVKILQNVIILSKLDPNHNVDTPNKIDSSISDKTKDSVCI